MEQIMPVLIEFVKAIAWALVAAISMSLSMGILLKVYDAMTPIDEWEEIRKGNIACAIIMAAVVLAFGFVVGMAISTPDTPAATTTAITAPQSTAVSVPAPALQGNMSNVPETTQVEMEEGTMELVPQTP